VGGRVPVPERESSLLSLSLSLNITEEEVELPVFGLGSGLLGLLGLFDLELKGRLGVFGDALIGLLGLLRGSAELGRLKDKIL